MTSPSLKKCYVLWGVYKRYDHHLENARKTQKEDEKKRAEKRKVSLEIKKLEEMRKVKKLKALKEEEEIKSKINMLEMKKHE